MIAVKMLNLKTLLLSYENKNKKSCSGFRLVLFSRVRNRQPLGPVQTFPMFLFRV